MRELVTSGQLKVEKVTSDHLLVDIYTKQLAKPRLKKLCKLIGLYVQRRCSCKWQQRATKGIIHVAMTTNCCLSCIKYLLGYIFV